jgi:hypothetical protein
MMDDLGPTLLLAFGLLCVLPLATFAVLAFVVIRAGQKRLEDWLGPDVEKLQNFYDDQHARFPQAAREALVRRVVQRQALRCGLVGALTGLGGLFTLPVALPIDIVLSFRIQAALVNFIAHHYGDSDPAGASATVRGYLVMTGSSRVTQTTTRVLSELALRLIGKSFAKLVPVIGAVIGFAVNYSIVQVMGRAALRWYISQRPVGTR